jgi:hypothetical protein
MKATIIRKGKKEEENEPMIVANIATLNEC